jgi:hypothetical protein
VSPFHLQGGRLKATGRQTDRQTARSTFFPNSGKNYRSKWRHISEEGSIYRGMWSGTGWRAPRCSFVTQPCVSSARKYVQEMEFPSGAEIPQDCARRGKQLGARAQETERHSGPVVRPSVASPHRPEAFSGISARLWHCHSMLQGLFTDKKNKLHGPSPRANYTDREIAAFRRSDCQLVRIKGATWSA